MTDSKTALVLGATGGIGGEMARQLRDAGWTVRALQRRATQPPLERQGITWIRGDAMNAPDVAAAAKGCSVIVHAVNPPGYQRWSELVLPMIDNSIAAAAAEGATLVLPGTLYNFGPDAFPVITEDSPQHPATRKGAVRAELERRLLQASQSGARVLIVRAGDFFGPGAGNNWFAQGLIAKGRRVSVVRNPGSPGIGHLWSYIPDVARTMIALLERRESLPPFAVFHMAGHWDPDGTRMSEAIREVVSQRGGRTPRRGTFPWWLVTLGSPFIALFREMHEVRYLWREPLRMDNARLRAALGSEPHTPLTDAVRATLEGLGALPALLQASTAAPATR